MRPNAAQALGMITAPASDSTRKSLVISATLCISSGELMLSESFESAPNDNQLRTDHG